MIPTAITKTITTLEEAEARLNLSRTSDPEFFLEWWQNLPELSEFEQAKLDRIRARYRYHSNSGHLTEGGVNLVVLSPVLELAGFYDPPFKLRAEVSVELQVATVSSELQGKPLQGRLDCLVVQERLWLAVLESKGTDMNLEDGIPQVLAYMFASPGKNPVYRLVTNGGQFCFLKLARQDVSQYDLSPLWSHLPLQNQLYPVLKVLKRVGQTFMEED